MSAAPSDAGPGVAPGRAVGADDEVRDDRERDRLGPRPVAGLAQTRRPVIAEETSRIAWVMWMSRGQASAQLKIVRQRHTPSLSARISSRSSAASSRESKMNRWAFTIAAGPTYSGLRPERRAGGRAGRAQDALGRVVVPRPVPGGLAALALGRHGVVLEERLDAPELGEEALHVDHEVLHHRQAGQRRHRDLLAAQLVHPDLAGEAVAAVDQHRVRPADAVGAGPAERERPVLLVLDLVEEVQDAVHRAGLDRVALLVGLVVPLGVVAEDSQLDRHRSLPRPSRHAAWAGTS